MCMRRLCGMCVYAASKVDYVWGGCVGVQDAAAYNGGGDSHY